MFYHSLRHFTAKFSTVVIKDRSTGASQHRQIRRFRWTTSRHDFGARDMVQATSNSSIIANGETRQSGVHRSRGGGITTVTTIATTNNIVTIITPTRLIQLIESFLNTISMCCRTGSTSSSSMSWLFSDGNVLSVSVVLVIPFCCGSSLTPQNLQ